MAENVLVIGGLPAKTLETLEATFACHHPTGSPADPVLDPTALTVRALARGGHARADRAFLEQLPKLEILANFGVGYDGIALDYCAERAIIVTNTPDVLTEEVADTALGLLLMTVRELSAAERHLRAGKWASEGNYRLTPATLRDRTVGIVGLGRIGMAIARRLDAMRVPVVYHARRERSGVRYRYFADLKTMAEAVDTLIVVVPGGAETRSMIDAAILDALGPRGVLVNIGRGSAVDEPALVEALAARRIHTAGLDVFADEPRPHPALLEADNVVLLPHVGSGSVFTRNAMGQLMVDNLKSWFEKREPLTPVAETPWPR